MLDWNTWNHLTVCKQMSANSFKNKVTNKLFAYKSSTQIYIDKIWHEITYSGWFTIKPNNLI